MIPKLTKYDPMFRNELIFAADAKNIALDTTLINLFMLMRNNGTRTKSKFKEYTLDSLQKWLKVLETEGCIEGYTGNEDAGEDWLRSNLVNMVSRGNIQKERISSLRPLHLESYRIRNVKFARDYNSSDQVYLMLSKQANVMQGLKDYLSIGWDNSSKSIVSNPHLDVDTIGILHLIRNAQEVSVPATSINQTKPILEQQADLFCDDIRRLLVYKDTIPRAVFIEYLQTLMGFHLSLYFLKLVVLLPRMVHEGKKEVDDNWNIVVDVTDNLDSNISIAACSDMQAIFNGLSDYMRSSLQINSVKMKLEIENSTKISSIDTILDVFTKRDEIFDNFFKFKYGDVKNRFTSDEEEEKKQLDEYVSFEKTYFDKYVMCLMKVRGAYQMKYTPQFIDKIAMKNTETAFIADGRSRRHPRRAVLGSKLLEVLIQLLVLEQEDGKWLSRPLSIDQLMEQLRQRYGVVINGMNEERFANANVQTHLAFKENVAAFKNKLRQIGFYTDLSDANILQKIRPRYKI